MPSVLRLHAWWGRTPPFVELGERLADAGFDVEVPDLHGDGRMAATIEELAWSRAIDFLRRELR
jgi:dienelactone hydrolase